MMDDDGQLRDDAGGVETRRDRRRPGRRNYTNPHLIALLRRPVAGSYTSPGEPAETGEPVMRFEEPEPANDLGPAFGIAWAVIIGSLLWIGLLVASYLFSPW